MKSEEILDILKKFEWSKLNKIYGSAHSSIIGFISHQWLSLLNSNTVLDGAPSPEIGAGRTGQKNADLLLCKDSNPFIPVEVETSVKQYEKKLDALNSYYDNFTQIEFVIMWMGNLTTGSLKYRHNWSHIKQKIQDNYSNLPISLISAQKEKINFQNNIDWSNLLKRNDYTKWEIINIDYWIKDNENEIMEGNFWKKD